MKVKLIKPTNKFLRQFIQYFFFIKNDDEKYNKTHVCYPNTNYCLGLHKGNRLVKLSDTDYKVLPSNNYHSYLTGIYQKPINVHYEGSFSEVCIDFEPLGLEVLTGEKVSTSVFVGDVIELAFPQYRSTIYDLAFGNENPYSCVSKLEKFFLSKIPEKNKWQYVAFNAIYAEQVEDLKGIYNKSYRSIHRVYKNSLNLSPIEFLNMQRFRKGIEQIHSANKLTDIAHDVGFSDQAHMSRDFKKYTGLSPKVFRTQSNLVDQTLCWTRK